MATGKRGRSTALGSIVLPGHMKKVRIKRDAMPKDIDGETLTPNGLVPMKERRVE